MNADEMEEAYKLLLAHGFHNAMGDGVIIEAEHFREAHGLSVRFEFMEHNLKRSNILTHFRYNHFGSI